VIKARSAKYTILVVLLLLVLGAGAAAWGFLTESGGKFTLERLQYVLKDAEYEFEGGNLAHGLALKNVQWKLKNNTTIATRHLTLTWSPWCWRGRHICLDQAVVEDLSINLVRPKIIRNPMVPKTISLPVVLSARILTVDKLVINRPDRPAIELHDLQFSGKFEETRIDAEKLSFNWRRLNAAVNGQLRLEKNYPISASGVFSADTQQTVEGNISLSGDLLNTQVNIATQKPLDASVSGQLSPLNRRAPLDLDISWTEGHLPFNAEAPTANLRNGQISLSGFKPDYDLTGSALLTTKHLPDANTIVDGKINTRQLVLNRLNLETLGGEIVTDGIVNFREKLAWETNVEIKNIDPGGLSSLPSGSLSGTMQFNGTSHQGSTHYEFLTLDLTGQSGKHPFTLSGDIVKDVENKWQFEQLNMLGNGNTIRTHGALSQTSDLAIDFALREPGLLNSGLGGDLAGRIRITGDRQTPDIRSDANSHQLHYGDVTLHNFRVDSHLAGGGTKPGFLTATSEGVTLPGTTLNRINLSIKGTRNNHTVSAGYKSESVQINNTRLNGKLDEHLNWTGKLLNVNGAIANEPLNLDKAFQLTWVQEKKALAVEPNCWSVSGTYACIDQPALIGRDGSINFNLNGLKLSALEPFIKPQTDLGGLIHSRGRIQWSESGGSQINVFANVTNGTVSTLLPAAKKPLTIDIQRADLNILSTGRGVKSTIKLESDQLGDIKANAHINVSNRYYPIRGTLQIEETSLAMLREMYPQVAIDSGTITAQISTKGTLKKPTLSGSLQITDASSNSEQLPLPLEKISIDAGIEDNKVTVSGTALSGSSPVNVNGTAEFGDNNWTATLNASGSDLKVKHEFVKSAVISPNVTLTLTPQRTIIDGNITLEDASIDIPKLDNSGVPLSGDIVIVDASDNSESVLKKPVTHGIIADLVVNLGRHIHFSGYGLNAELNGQTRVILIPGRTPELLGVVNVQNGTYRSYGQSLNIRQGNINFVGPIERTALQVEAVRNTGTVLAGIRIEGTLDNPETTLFSDPPMPEEHILPYVVLGRPLEIGGDTDDSQLITNAALFMGITNGRSLTKNIASNLGIDDFTMNAAGSGEDTQVMLSGRLNDRLLVRYGLGVFNSVNTLFLRYDLAEQLYLETTQGLEKAVDVFYSFEFD
jgi:translocation and assembly module TamB